MYNEKQPDYNYKSRLTDPHQLLIPLELQQELKLSGAKNVASFPNDPMRVHCAEVRNFTLYAPTPKAGLLPEATFAWILTQADAEVFIFR